MTDDEITALLGRIEVIWTQGPLSRAGVREWQQALRYRTITDAHDALNDFIEKGRGVPNLGRFMAAINDLHPTSTQPGLFTADMAAPWDGPTEGGRLAMKRARDTLNTTLAWKPPKRAIDPEEEAE